MEMTILVRDDGITHVVLAGRLDTTAVEQIDKSFTDAAASRNQPAVVDLSRIEFMASRGIGMLLANSKRLEEIRPQTGPPESPRNGGQRPQDVQDRNPDAGRA